ncbi:MAG: molecular chaperone [Dehalococcoidia bacterium]
MVRTSESKVLPVAATPPRSELARSRARIYRALAIGYARPADEQLLELFRPWGILETELPQRALPVMMKRGLRKLGAWLERRGSQPPEELLIALGVEFTRLFRGLNRFHSPPPPYESVYVDSGLVYGPSTDQVTQTYRRFRLKGQNNEPPDHIALELDFMRFLCQREALAWQTEKGGQDLLKEEDAFLKEHLAGWVPALCQNIRRFDTSGFYDGLADVTEGWICCDRRIIRGLIDL